MPDYFAGENLAELVGGILAEAKRPGVSRPDVPLSKKQIEIHYDDLYMGYLKKLGEIERKLKAADLKPANANFSEFRELKHEELFVVNSIRLHEGYFENLGSNKQTDHIIKAITTDFGSIAKWENNFIACGLSARGWAVLGYDCHTKSLVNVITDSHDMGMWGVEPLLILDMYEHAYMIDFGSNKSKYIEFFMSHVNWSKVSERLAECE
jgi:Fe-Mn family superoxide dismutase